MTLLPAGSPTVDAEEDFQVMDRLHELATPYGRVDDVLSARGLAAREHCDDLFAAAELGTAGPLRGAAHIADRDS